MHSCRICDFDLCYTCHTKKLVENEDISVVGGEEMTMPPSSFCIRIKWPRDETQDLSYNSATWPGYRWGLQLESQIRSGTGSVETLWNHRIWEEQSGSQHGTALWFAVREGDQACAERLITMGSNVNQVGQKLCVYNSCGLHFVESAPLLEACVSHNTAMVKVLLGHGAWAQQPGTALTGCPCLDTMWTYQTRDALGAMLGGAQDVITNKAALWAKPDEASDKKDAELAVCAIAALLLRQPGVSAVAQTQHTARGDVVDHENADFRMPGFFEHPTRWWLGPRMRGFTPDWPGPVQLGLASALEQLAETSLAHLLPSMMELADCTNPLGAPLVFPMATARRPLAALPAATREFNTVRIKSRFSWALVLALYKAGRATPRDAWMRSGAAKQVLGSPPLLQLIVALAFPWTCASCGGASIDGAFDSHGMVRCTLCSDQAWGAGARVTPPLWHVPPHEVVAILHSHQPAGLGSKSHTNRSLKLEHGLLWLVEETTNWNDHFWSQGELVCVGDGMLAASLKSSAVHIEPYTHLEAMYGMDYQRKINKTRREDAESTIGSRDSTVLIELPESAGGTLQITKVWKWGCLGPMPLRVQDDKVEDDDY